MLRDMRYAVCICLILVITSGCSHTPDHARYIPKDATIVIGVDLKSLTKKVAWNALTGSDLFKKIQERLSGKPGTPDALADAGVDAMNTIYLYIKGDKRYRDNNRITALIPLSDAGKWENYIKTTFPNAQIVQKNGRKEAKLTDNMYAGWNSKLLIIMNVVNIADYTGSANTPNTAKNPILLPAEMDAAFSVMEENTLIGDARFRKLQTEAHDIFFWTNYDQLMGQYMTQSNDGGMMGGLSMASNLWKNAALTAGFDFEKGKIAGTMHYYAANDIRGICKEMGATNADKDMIDRLPSKNLDMLITMHLSTKGVRALLDKMGMLGLMNVALSQQGMDADYVLDAFTGDMAVALNDLTIKEVAMQTPLNGEMMKSNRPDLNFLYVLKINKKQNFDKLVGIAQNAGLTQTGTNTYVLPYSLTDSIYLITNNTYALITNKQANAVNYMQGTNKGQKLPANANVYGHPTAFYFDMQQIAKAINPSMMAADGRDSAMIEETKNLLDNMDIHGGAFTGDAFEYHIALNFMNKKENSLLQLMDFAMKVNDTKNRRAAQPALTDSTVIAK